MLKENCLKYTTNCSSNHPYAFIVRPLDTNNKDLRIMLMEITEEQEKKLNNLSGGEKHRMYLSKLMIEGGNFLILDEPTNHLDLEAIIALGEALYKFSGNILCVSHDRELIDAFANRIIELIPTENGARMIDFKGSYEEYLESKN